MLVLDLPEDLKVYFFRFLEIRNVLNLRLLSHGFKNWLDGNSSVWKYLYSIHFPGKSLEMSIFELSWHSQFKSTWEFESKIRWHDHKNGAVYEHDSTCAAIKRYCTSILLLRARVGIFSIHSLINLQVILTALTTGKFLLAPTAGTTTTSASALTN